MLKNTLLPLCDGVTELPATAAATERVKNKKVKRTGNVTTASAPPTSRSSLTGCQIGGRLVTGGFGRKKAYSRGGYGVGTKPLHGRIDRKASEQNRLGIGRMSVEVLVVGTPNGGHTNGCSVF